MASSKRQHELDDELEQKRLKAKEEYKLEWEERDRRFELKKRIHDIIDQLKQICPDNYNDQRVWRNKNDITAEENRCKSLIKEEKEKRTGIIKKKIEEYKNKLKRDIPNSFCGYQGELTIFDQYGNKTKIEGVPYNIPNKYYTYKSSILYKAGSNPENDTFWNKIKEHYLERKYTINLDAMIEYKKFLLDSTEDLLIDAMHDLEKAKSEFSVFEKATIEESERIKEQIRNSLVPDTPEVLELKKQKADLIAEYNAKFMIRCENCGTAFEMDKNGETRDHFDSSSWTNMYTCSKR